MMYNFMGKQRHDTALSRLGLQHAALDTTPTLHLQRGITHDERNKDTGEMPSIYICALSKSQPWWKDTAKTPVMFFLLQSIAETTKVSRTRYNITVLLGVDSDDVFWKTQSQTFARESMDKYGVTVRVNTYPSHASGVLPFNSLMRDAFNDSAEYMVRVNDDTQFKTPGWIELGISQLQSFSPPNVGVVGPTCHEGNTKILTHDMVHRTHLLIFDTYYPPLFHNWYIDDWISTVYGVANTAKIRRWVVHHHTELGTRYKPATKDSKFLKSAVTEGAAKIKSFLSARTTGPVRTGSSESMKPNVMQVHVLTQKRAASLQALLNSLENTDFGGDTVDVFIHVDYSTESAPCIEVARNFNFSSGTVSYSVSTTGKGLRDSWFNAWQPQPDQRAIILEDDIELSVHWYRWLKSAWDHTETRSDLAGISLQRQTLVPRKPHKQMEIINRHDPFLYALVGSIGFSPHWKQWKKFLAWVASNDVETVDITMKDLVTSDWFDILDRRSMWTHYFVWFCRQNDLYTLYVNLPGAKTLAAHKRLRGEHSDGTQGRDFEVAQHVDAHFPQTLSKYGWDGQILPPTDGADTPTTGSMSIQRNSSTETQHSLETAIQQIRTVYGFVRIQLLNEGYVEFTKSWICNVRTFPEILQSTLFIATDLFAYDALRRLDTPLHIVLEPYKSPAQLTYGQYAYYDFMLFRTALVLRMLRTGATLWLTESDSVWFRDPTSQVLAAEGDIVTMNDDTAPRRMTQGGFILLRATPTTQRVWSRLVAQFSNKMNHTRAGVEMGDTGSEQLMMNALVQTEPNLKLAWLDPASFISGKYYSMQRKPSHPAVVLNNWIAGNAAKKQRAKLWGHWFLDETGHCMAPVPVAA